MAFSKPSVKRKVADEQLEKKIEAFGQSAPIHSVTAKEETKVDAQGPSPDDKPNKGFTVPLNEYELELLRKLQQHEDRSMRVIARRIFTKALYTAAEEININQSSSA